MYESPYFFSAVWGGTTVLVRRAVHFAHAGMPEWSKGPDSSANKLHRKTGEISGSH